MTIPRTKFNNLPYSDSFTDIDKDNTIIQIGNTDYYENVFENTNDCKYIETICELIPNYNFNNIEVSMKYRNEINDHINKIAKYNLYDNSIIKMDNIVSSIDIVLKDVINVKSDIQDDIIYTKYFGKQNKNITLQPTEEENKSGINTISNAYLFGGYLNQDNINSIYFI